MEKKNLKSTLIWVLISWIIPYMLCIIAVALSIGICIHYGWEDIMYYPIWILLCTMIPTTFLRIFICANGEKHNE